MVRRARLAQAAQLRTQLCEQNSVQKKAKATFHRLSLLLQNDY
jgi:hypothetical protein